MQFNLMNSAHPTIAPYLTNALVDPYYVDPYYVDMERESELYYRGDTWRFWIGPLPSIKESSCTTVVTELRKVFQRSNKIRECIERHVSSLVGDPFHWYLLDAQQERAEVPDTEKQLQAWLEWVAESAIASKDSTDPWWKCVRDMCVGGRGYLRLWMPKKFASNPNPIRRVHLHSPDPKSVEVDRDEEGFVKSISYRYGENCKEVQTMDDRGILTIATFKNEIEIESYTLDLGGRWTIYELTAESMISGDVKDAQNNINLAKTMQSRTLIQNGFVERVLMNAQLPGQWVDDDAEPTGQRFVPAAEVLEVGPGRTAFIQGAPVYDELGRVSGYANPSINYKDPAPVESFQTSIAGDIEQIYHSMGQGHLLQGDAQLSGVSRVQMRQDAEVKSQRHEKTIKAAFSGIISAFLATINARNFTAIVELRKSTHWLAPEEQAQIVAAYNNGLLSKATAIARLGMVDDPDAEIALIEDETKAAMEMMPQPKIDPTIEPENPPAIDPSKQPPENQPPEN